MLPSRFLQVILASEVIHSPGATVIRAGCLNHVFCFKLSSEAITYSYTREVEQREHTQHGLWYFSGLCPALLFFTLSS